MVSDTALWALVSTKYKLARKANAASPCEMPRRDQAEQRSSWEPKQLKHPVVMPIHRDGMVAGGRSPMKARGQREGVAPNPFSDKKQC